MTPPPFPGNPENHPGRDAQSPRPPRHDDSETRMMASPQPKKGTSVWLWIGLGIAVVGVAAAVVLWLLSRSERTYDYSDGKNPAVEQEQGSIDLEEQPVSNPAPEVINRALSGHVYVSGTLAEFPFTLDLDITPDGDVTGTYWNVLYDLRFSVSGTREGTDDLHLTLSRDGVSVPLELTSEGSGRYVGYWGKKKNEARASLTRGTRPSGNQSSASATRMRVQGNGINSPAYFSPAYMWYVDQGSGEGHKVRLEQNGIQFTLYNDEGTELATGEIIETVHGVSGIMHDRSGKTFELIGE